MNILITGGTGQVGFELRRSLAIYGSVIAPARDELDLYDSEAVACYLDDAKPDLIVNAAAYTAVDRAETEPEKARRLNAALPEQLAGYAASRGVWLIHYSSDYVYPGTGVEPYDEASPVGPLGVYGQSKLAGDQAIISTAEKYLIFRTSWVYSARGNNFMKTMLRLGKERDALSVVADQVGAPTPARLIADITAAAVGRVLVRTSPYIEDEAHNTVGLSGLYHLAPKGEASWHQFACEIFKRASQSGIELEVTPARVSAISTEEYPTPAMRPKNSRLQLSKIEQAFGIELPDWRNQLALTLEEYLTVSV